MRRVKLLMYLMSQLNNEEKFIYFVYYNKKWIIMFFNDQLDRQIAMFIKNNKSALVWIFIISFLTELLVIKLFVGVT